MVAGPLETRTGGYEYDRRIVEGLRRRGWSVEVRELGGGFPQPAPEALATAARALAAIPDGTIVLVDGLAFGAMPAEIEREASRLRIVPIVHLPLAAEIGLDAGTAKRLEASERRALAAAALVVVTGSLTATALLRYGVERDRIALVEPGTDRAPLARGSGSAPEVIHLLVVAALTPGKGHEILMRALGSISSRNWRLTCVGSLLRDPPTVDRVRGIARAGGLDDRVSFAGELGADALAACYDTADVFVLATLLETYGMAVAEALARGLPVISTTTGAIPGLVRDRAGLVVPPGDVEALAGALTRTLGDAGVREQFAEGARRVRDQLPTWEDAVGKMASAIERVRTR